MKAHFLRLHQVTFKQNELILVYLLIIGAFIAFLLPWAQHPVSSLSMNAFDLAEWTSLHPASRSATLPLMPSFLLRMQPVFLGWLVCLLSTNAYNPRRMPSITLTMLIVIIFMALFPPLEFFQNLDDANYRQQFMLSLILIAGAGLCVFLIQNLPTPRFIPFIIIGVGIMTTIAGMLQAEELLASFDFGAEMGIGYGLMLLIYVGTGVVLIIKQTRRPSGDRPAQFAQAQPDM